MITLMLSLALCLASTHTAVAQESENAYDYWSMTIPYFNPSDANGVVSEPLFSVSDQDLLSGYLAGPMRPPSALEQSALQRAQPILDLLTQAAGADHYDSNIDFSPGIATEMPHLFPMRRGHDFLLASARAHAAQGEVKEATLAMEHLNTLSSHALQDGSMIGSLISGNQFRNADEHLDDLIGAGLINQENAGKLLESLEPFTQTDPLNLSKSMEHEELFMLDIIDELIDASAEDQKAIVSDIGFELPEDFSTESLLEERALTESIFSAVHEGLEDPDLERGEATLMRASAMIDEHASKNGVLSALMPAFDKILDFRARFQNRLDQRLRQLQALSDGRVGPDDLRNAAIIWLSAGTSARTLPLEIQEAAIHILNLNSGVSSEENSTHLRRWKTSNAEYIAPLLTAARDAASIPYADFSITDATPPLLNPEYMGDLRAIARVLLADASLKMNAWAYANQETEDADEEAASIDALRGAEDIGATMALIQHLVHDPSQAHSILAAGIFSDAAHLLNAYVDALSNRTLRRGEDSQFDAMIRTSLRAALDAIPRADIFALTLALETNQIELLSFWTNANFRREHPEENKNLMTFVDALSFDQLAAISAGMNRCGPIDSMTQSESSLHDTPAEDLRSISAFLLGYVSDIFPLTPPGLGDGQRRYMQYEKIKLHAFEDDPDMDALLDGLNTDPVSPFELRIREQIVRLADIEEMLRVSPVFPSRPAHD